MARSIGISTFVRIGLLIYGVAAVLPWTNVILLLGMITVVSGLIEIIGLRSGIPFGRYRYTNLLRPQIAGLPLQIMFEWTLVTIPTWAVLSHLNLGIVAFSLASGLVIMGWDLFYDHFFVALGFWQWQKQRRALAGIPCTNYLGWFLTGGVLSAAAYVLFPLDQLGTLAFLPAFYLLMFGMQIVLQCFIASMRNRLAYMLGIVAVGWPLVILYW